MIGSILFKTKNRKIMFSVMVVFIYVISYLLFRIAGVLCDRSYTDDQLNLIWRKVVICHNELEPNWVSVVYQPLFYLEIKTGHFGLPFYLDLKIWKESVK